MGVLAAAARAQDGELFDSATGLPSRCAAWIERRLTSMIPPPSNAGRQQRLCNKNRLRSGMAEKNPTLLVCARALGLEKMRANRPHRLQASGTPRVVIALRWHLTPWAAAAGATRGRVGEWTTTQRQRAKEATPASPLSGETERAPAKPTLGRVGKTLFSLANGALGTNFASRLIHGRANQQELVPEMALEAGPQHHAKGGVCGWGRTATTETSAALCFETSAMGNTECYGAVGSLVWRVWVGRYGSWWVDGGLGLFDGGRVLGAGRLMAGGQWEEPTNGQGNIASRHGTR